MNIVQRQTLLHVADKLTMLGYAFGQEIADSAEQIDSGIAYDLASALRDLEAELLTLPHKKA
jgi:hypothetical protein